MDAAAHVTLIGGPTVLIEVGGVRLLTDPTFDRAGSTYPLGPFTMVKSAGPALPQTALGRIDAVLLSHDQHPDNLDAAGRAVLRTARLVLTTTAAADRLGGAAVGLQPGEQRVVSAPTGTVTVTAVHAEHGPAELSTVLGPVIGFQIGPDRVRQAIYVSGDTVQVNAVPATSIGLAILHGGAARLPALSPAALSFTAADLVGAARRLGGCPVVVVHHEGWDHFSEDPATIAAAFQDAGFGDRLMSLTPGVPTHFPLS